MILRGSGFSGALFVLGGVRGVKWFDFSMVFMIFRLIFLFFPLQLLFCMLFFPKKSFVLLE